MNMTIFEEIEQISAEMNVIINRSKQEGRGPSREEQDALEKLSMDKEMLVGDTVFHGYI